jgi:hypothetical protein
VLKIYRLFAHVGRFEWRIQPFSDRDAMARMRSGIPEVLSQPRHA